MKPLKFDIIPEHHFASTTSGPRYVAVKRGDSNELVIGTDILRQYMIHRNAASQTMAFQASTSADALSVENLIFMLVLSVLYARWRITDLNSVIGQDARLRNAWYNLFFEACGVGIAIASYVLPSSLSILTSHRVIYITTGVVIGLSVVFKALSVYRSYTFDENDLEQYEPIFENNLMRSLTQEVLLLTGLWLVLLERRLEFASTALVLLTNIFLVYVVLFYLFLVIAYVVFTKERSLVPFSFISFVCLLFALLLYQTLIAINFFARPIFVRDYATYEKVLVPFLVMLYMLLATVAMYIVRLYFKKGQEVVLADLDKKIKG
jgi:hypothetical protein